MQALPLVRCDHLDDHVLLTVISVLDNQDLNIH